MKRRTFLKCVTALPFAGVVCAKQEVPDVSPSQTSRNIYFEDTILSAKDNVIRWCPLEKLGVYSTHWRKVTLPFAGMDVFEFWQWDKGKLFWCGKRKSKWEVRTHRECEIELRFMGFGKPSFVDDTPRS